MNNLNYSENSRFAYLEIQDSIPDCQSDILATFIIHKERGKSGLTAKEVSKLSGHPINTVVARINELMFEKQVLKIEKVVMQGKRPVNFYCLRSNSDPVNVRKLTWKEKFEKAGKDIAESLRISDNETKALAVENYFKKLAEL